jgi:hypothetical protein
MQIMERPMTGISGLISGNTIGVTTKKNSQILDVFSRDDNIFMSLLEEGDISVVRNFVVAASHTNIDHLQQKPFRFITRMQTQQPSYWTPANGYHSVYYPVNYYIFEVLQ